MCKEKIALMEEDVLIVVVPTMIRDALEEVFQVVEDKGARRLRDV